MENTIAVKKVYEETDEKGKHKVIEQANGIKIRLLREPSEAYQEKMRLRGIAANEQRLIQEAEQKRKRKIQLQCEIDAGTKLGLDVSKEQAELNALLAGQINDT